MSILGTMWLSGYAIGWLITFWAFLYKWVYPWQRENFFSQQQALAVAAVGAVFWPLVAGALLFIGTLATIGYVFKPIVFVLLTPIKCRQE